MVSKDLSENTELILDADVEANIKTADLYRALQQQIQALFKLIKTVVYANTCFESSCLILLLRL